MQHFPEITPAAHHNVPRPDPVRIDQLSARIAKWREEGRAPDAPLSLTELRRIHPFDVAREIHAGRGSWTRTDYLAAGYAEFDANVDTATHPAFTPYAPANRDRYARAYVDMHMPRAW